jgi:hypothetical protein
LSTGPGAPVATASAIHPRPCRKTRDCPTVSNPGPVCTLS